MFISNGRPFIMLAGEAHNSNSSSLAAMEPVWEKAKELCLNSVLLPVSWELIEPEEGKFDFSLVDGLILEARKRGFKLGFLWFGAWKNAQCTYAPEWVKTDLERFQRAEIHKGERRVRLDMFHGLDYSTLSCFCEETKRADAKAFAALMARLKEVDEGERTVLFVQVENESGILGAVREHSETADRLFAGEVPDGFTAHMKSQAAGMREDIRRAVESGADSGTWGQVFGAQAEEIFQAYYVASYIDFVADAGKSAYDLPLTVNAWLEQGEPGNYPSGGAVSKLMEVYKFAAPHVDAVCPDIYVPDFCGVCDGYTRLGNPLCIPETATHSLAGPRLVYSIGHYHAWCFAPFGFEELGDPMRASAALGMDESDPLLSTPQNVEEYAWYNRTLHSLMPLLAEAYGIKRLQAAICERPDESAMDFGSFTVRAGMDSPLLSRRDGCCLALQIAENEFYLVVNGCVLEVTSNDPDMPQVELLSLEEGSIVDGKWERRRRLNGDEAFVLAYGEPALLRMKVFAYR